jgi:hypothetical protein
VKLPTWLQLTGKEAIERHLVLLDEFWAVPENENQQWSGNKQLQIDYYRFMQSKGFASGDAPRPEKDAREKTSGLVAIGLIDDELRLTSAGRALLNITLSGDFSSDNLLQIAADSFVYLKQLLKTSSNIDGDIVRPYALLAYALLKLGHLSDDEFTYLLPLCVNKGKTEAILCALEGLRNGNRDIDGIIKTCILSMENYEEALKFLLSQRVVTEDVIADIGMNRKSGSTGEKSYDRAYYPIYRLLRSIIRRQDDSLVESLYGATGNLSNSKVISQWRQYLFNTTARSRLRRDGLSALNDVPLLRATSEREFKKLFFEQMHLFKAKATLSDYADLNRRYFKTTDTVILADRKVEFDVLPRCWLYGKEADLLSIAFTDSDELADDIELSQIAPFLAIDETALYANLQALYGITVQTAADAERAVHGERYRRFNALIDERFDRDTLINLLSMFERRDDNAIRQAVTNNADIPTIFEYVLGIAWYLISNRNGDVLSYMNLSLEADLLPRTHAAGGNADIEYIYEQTAVYPAHTLLIEATLADNSNQRRMEMEPVSRHLGEYILSSGDRNAYCVFVSTFLHPTVVGDFRSWKSRPYYGRGYESTEVGLKILPLATAELQTILEKRVNYTALYPILEAAYQSDEPVPTWYERDVIDILLKHKHYV